MAPQNVSALVEDLFRTQAAKMTAVILKIVGLRNLETAEDVVQETLFRAFQIWPIQGIPLIPESWLMQTSKNLAIDYFRSRKSRFGKYSDRIGELDEALAHHSDPETVFEPAQIQDALLKMIFACCDPRLAIEDQIALTLKLCCGLSSHEIASALLVTPVAIEKRLFRAKKLLRALGRESIEDWHMSIPSRLDGVLHVLYLLFTEGHKPSSGAKSLRIELCTEAMRLTLLLLDDPTTKRPKASALMALMLFQSARFPSREFEDGSICQLQFQDRSEWNRRLISEGYYHLERSAIGDELSRFHLEAGIAAFHCQASSFETTDWSSICFLYDQLAQLNESPITRLNRAIALGFAKGPEVAVTELHLLEKSGALDRYFLLPASLAEFYDQLGRHGMAVVYFELAIAFCPLESERQFLLRKEISSLDCLAVKMSQQPKETNR